MTRPSLVTDPANTIETALVVVARLQSRAMEAVLADLELNSSQTHILRFLYFLSTQGEPSPIQTEIAERLYYQKAATGVALDVLAARGLVERSPSAHDRRALVVTITPAGVRAARQVEKQLAALNQAVVDGLTDAELKSLSAALARIRENLLAERKRLTERET